MLSCSYASLAILLVILRGNWEQMAFSILAVAALGMGMTILAAAATRRPARFSRA